MTQLHTDFWEGRRRSKQLPWYRSRYCGFHTFIRYKDSQSFGTCNGIVRKWHGNVQKVELEGSGIGKTEWKSAGPAFWRMDPQAAMDISFRKGSRMAGANRAVGHWRVFLKETPFRIKARNGVFIFWTNGSGGFWGTTHLGVRRFSRLFSGRFSDSSRGVVSVAFSGIDSHSSFRHGAPRLPLPPPSHSAVICGRPRGRRRRYGGCGVRAECRCQELHWPHSG